MPSCSRHNERLRAATRIGPGDRVLDIGCGAGQSTRDAARAAASGSALGVDVSDEMLERARRRTAEEGLRNVDYQRGDVQVHPLPPAHFDVVISRFGTMFFSDPVAAFTSVARAARPGARLVMMVWQGQDRNEWATAIRQALTGGAAPAQPASGPDPFSLAEPARVESILGAAGFVEVAFADVHEPVYYGPDAGGGVRPRARHEDDEGPARGHGGVGGAGARWPGCASSSPPTTPARACCSTRGPGSSRPGGSRGSRWPARAAGVKGQGP